MTLFDCCCSIWSFAGSCIQYWSGTSSPSLLMGNCKQCGWRLTTTRQKNCADDLWVRNCRYMVRRNKNGLIHYRITFFHEPIIRNNEKGASILNVQQTWSQTMIQWHVHSLTIKQLNVASLLFNYITLSYGYVLVFCIINYSTPQMIPIVVFLRTKVWRGTHVFLLVFFGCHNLPTIFFDFVFVLY